jgi:hypothetical protein
MADNKQPTPQDNTLNADTQTVGFKKGPEPNKDESWKKVEAVFNAAKSAFLEKNSPFADVLDSLIATLMDIRAADKQGLGGMGTDNPQMDIPAPTDNGQNL